MSLYLEQHHEHLVFPSRNRKVWMLTVTSWLGTCCICCQLFYTQFHTPTPVIKDVSQQWTVLYSQYIIQSIFIFPMIVFKASIQILFFFFFFCASKHDMNNRSTQISICLRHPLMPQPSILMWTSQWEPESESTVSSLSESESHFRTTVEAQSPFSYLRLSDLNSDNTCTLQCPH